MVRIEIYERKTAKSVRVVTTNKENPCKIENGVAYVETEKTFDFYPLSRYQIFVLAK